MREHVELHDRQTRSLGRVPGSAVSSNSSVVSLKAPSSISPQIFVVEISNLKFQLQDNIISIYFAAMSSPT
jgi:hypothetical protein